jgi:hypothetical protein
MANQQSAKLVVAIKYSVLNKDVIVAGSLSLKS